MVVARTKLMIHEDLLRPSPIMRIHYTGKNPERFYKEIPGLLRTVFRISEQQIQEKKFVWSKGDPEKFKVEWELNKDLDKFSYLFVEVILEGETSKGEGTADVIIAGALRTEYPQDSVWERSIVYEFFRTAWHNIFYHSKTSRYYREGRRLIGLFIEKVKELTK